MSVVSPNGIKIDNLENPIPGLASIYSIIMLKSILTPIFDINYTKKSFVDQK